MKTGTNDGAALDRLRDLLDAYGGDPDRWPAAEREPALDLLARSADARRLREDALRLDAALDLLPAAEPSPGLEERIVAAARSAPQQTEHVPEPVSLAEARVRRDAGRATHRRRLLLAAALPLAAAATLALWLARADRTQPQRVAAARGTTQAVSTTEVASEDELLAALGSYSTPDDALLELPGLDNVYDTDPWRGCSEGDLGCVRADSLSLEPLSREGTEMKEVRMLS